MKYNRDLKRTLEEIRREPRVGRPRSERRREARERKLPLDRRCPECGRVRLRSRQWVCVDGVAKCKSCWMMI